MQINTLEKNEERKLLDQLTDRQVTVLKMICEEYSTHEIAEKMDISVKTVESHRAAVKAKLNIYSIPGLTKYAIRAGLISI